MKYFKNIYEFIHNKARFLMHLCTSVNLYRGLGEKLYLKAISSRPAREQTVYFCEQPGLRSSRKYTPGEVWNG